MVRLLPFSVLLKLLQLCDWLVGGKEKKKLLEE